MKVSDTTIMLTICFGCQEEESQLLMLEDLFLQKLAGMRWRGGVPGHLGQVEAVCSIHPDESNVDENYPSCNMIQ